METEKLVIISHNIGENSSPNGSKSITVRMMGGATGLLAELVVLLQLEPRLFEKTAIAHSINYVKSWKYLCE